MNLVKKTFSPHILIIDDSVADCQLIGKILERAGFVVSFVTSGYEGLTQDTGGTSSLLDPYCYLTRHQWLRHLPSGSGKGSLSQHSDYHLELKTLYHRSELCPQHGSGSLHDKAVCCRAASAGRLGCVTPLFAPSYCRTV